MYCGRQVEFMGRPALLRFKLRWKMQPRMRKGRSTVACKELADWLFKERRMKSKNRMTCASSAAHRLRLACGEKEDW